MAKRLLSHFDRIIAWYDHEISMGPLEGTSNKIKVLQQKSYGFRDDDLDPATDTVSTPERAAVVWGRNPARSGRTEIQFT